MAYIQQRGKSYTITVSCGYSANGKQQKEHMKYTPDNGMTEKQIEKELKRQAVLFEEKCKQGHTNKAIKFEEYARQWFTEYAELTLKKQTLKGYYFSIERIYKAIGHLKLSAITTRDINKYVLALSDAGLSPKTIKNHICLISSIFSHAIKTQQASFNPCANATIPRDKPKEKDFYTLEETNNLLGLLQQEDGKDFKYAVFFTLAAFTGLRRGELLGLEWKDINMETGVITVKRTSNWTKELGIYTDTPKSDASRRPVRLREEVIAFIQQFREYQDKEKEMLGDKWQENDRLFTQWDGAPMSTNAPHAFFKRLCKRTGMKYVNIHSWRHFNASLLIFSGLDVKTVQSHLGHSSATTTLSIYCHEIQEAKAAVTEAFNVIQFGTQKTA
jgi:integrase